MIKALITGVTGQDGAYLSKFLLDKGYSVIALYRRTSSPNFWRIDYLGIKNHPNILFVQADLTDSASIRQIINDHMPDEIYNLAAQSFVRSSFEQPHLTTEVNSIGVLNILETLRTCDKKIKFYQASTSEMFGKVANSPQNEDTVFYPRSPYGVSKVYSHYLTINYRESYDIFCCLGILFNHESPLRGIEFVTRKITDAVSRIKCGLQENIELGNLDARRDWGYALDYVEGMWLMMQAKYPSTYVLATNKTTTIRDFVILAFEYVGIHITFKNKGVDEIGVDSNGITRVKVNPSFYRPSEVDLLIGDYSKANKELGWQPKTDLSKLIKLMIDEDLKRNT